ncbi:MAG: GNAT family N-acetyltransferase [Candidatus Nanohalobium sp.]
MTGVFVSEEYRGEGFGKEVVSKAAGDALEKDLIPCYRTLEKWRNSVNLAKSLGFEKYATTYLLKLAEL